MGFFDNLASRSWKSCFNWGRVLSLGSSLMALAVWEALRKAIHGFLSVRCAANAVCGLLQNRSLGAIDFAGTSLCRGRPEFFRPSFAARDEDTDQIKNNGQLAGHPAGSRFFASEGSREEDCIACFNITGCQ